MLHKLFISYDFSPMDMSSANNLHNPIVSSAYMLLVAETSISTSNDMVNQVDVEGFHVIMGTTYPWTTVANVFGEYQDPGTFNKLFRRF